MKGFIHATEEIATGRIANTRQQAHQADRPAEVDRQQDRMKQRDRMRFGHGRGDSIVFVQKVRTTNAEARRPINSDIDIESPGRNLSRAAARVRDGGSRPNLLPARPPWCLRSGAPAPSPSHDRHGPRAG
jgi:hypothetical protein